MSVLLIKPVTILCVKAQIKKVTGAQRVLVGGCHLEFFHGIRFYDVQIDKQQEFYFTVKEASVRFNPWLLMAGASPDHFVDELHLSDMAARSNPSHFVLENGTLTVNQKTPGVLSVNKIQWGRLSVYKIKSIACLENKKLFFKSLTGQG